MREGVNGVCLPDDSKPEEFARAIMGIVKDAGQYSALYLGAFSEYEGNLNWDSVAGTLANLCQELRNWDNPSETDE